MQTQPVSSPRKNITIPDADAYIFDIDGTLLVTKDLVHWNALHQAMIEAYGGDTPSDVEAARDAGAQILAVASGTFSLDELSACSPDLCVSHCDEFFPD